MSECGKPLRRVNYYREVVDDVCTAAEGHDGACITDVGARYIEVECVECGEDVTVPDSKHAEPYHSGCYGYPLCSCAVPHRGDCRP